VSLHAEIHEELAVTAVRISGITIKPITVLTKQNALARSISAMEPTRNIEEIDLHKHLLVLQRHWVPAVGVFVAVVSVAFLNALSLKPTYKAEGSLLIKTNHTTSLTGMGEPLGRVESLAINDSPSDTQAKIVGSVPVIEKTITDLNLRDDQGQPLKIRNFTKKLKVEGTKGTEVLQVSYMDENPVVAAKVVNKVMQEYIRNNIEANRAETVAARKFIMEQLPATEASVKAAESALRKFKEDNKIIALQEQATATVQEISKLEEQIAQDQAQLVDATARSQKLQKQAAIASQKAATFASLSQVPGIQQVLAQLQDVQGQLAVARTRLQPQHPTILNLQERAIVLNNLLQQRIKQAVGSNQRVSSGNLQIGDLRQKLIEDFTRSEAERSGLAKQIATLSHKRELYKERANILPKLEETQRELERKLKASQTTYEALLTRLQEVQVAENQNIGNARIVSPALQPDKPSGSRKQLTVAGGGVLGLLLGVITALSLDLIDRSVKTLKQAKDLFQYTPLGVIPALSRKGERRSHSDVDRPIPQVIGRDIPQFPLGNAYQMLQANLKFLNSDKKLRAIAITSSVSKEGKSEVSANLAMTMAQVGHKVLLVDADMRRPIQHHIWGLTNKSGLSDVLVNEANVNNVVHEVVSNLFVIPSGTLPPNPIALLDSKRMATLLASFVSEYDFVIFDTPPLAGTADASVLGKLADGILLVVRPKVVSVTSANAAKEFLTHSGQNVLGMVINGVNVKREPDSYFYYTTEQLDQDFGLQNSALKKPSRSKVVEKR